MYYPIMIDMIGKRVTVFGGGKIAYRKALSLLQCGGKVVVVSRSFIEDFDSLKTTYPEGLVLIEDEYKVDYLEKNYLVIAATNNEEINEEIGAHCQKNYLLCNMVQSGDLSDFILPSVVRRGDLTIAVSTSGKSPSLSKKIKKDLEERYPDDLEEYVNLLGKIREKVLRQEKGEEEKKRVLNGLVDKSLEELKLMNFINEE